MDTTVLQDVRLMAAVPVEIIVERFLHHLDLFRYEIGSGSDAEPWCQRAVKKPLSVFEKVAPLANRLVATINASVAATVDDLVLCHPPINYTDKLKSKFA